MLHTYIHTYIHAYIHTYIHGPHALLKLKFDIEAATREYRQMPYFPPLPKVPDIDFRPWTTYQSQAHVVELYGNPPNKPAQAWADWLSKTEQYLLQENPWAAQGGLHLVPQAKAHTWRKGRPAYWEQLRAVLHLALQQPVTTCTGPVQSFTQRTRHAHRHWVEAPRWGQFLDTCHHWH